jgi:DNA-binding NarL/FixJ family response regulator
LTTETTEKIGINTGQSFDYPADLLDIMPFFWPKDLEQRRFSRTIRAMEPCESMSAAQQRIRLFLLAEQALFRASLGRLLTLEPDFELVGECTANNGAMEQLKESAADIALLEVESDATDAGEFMFRAARAGYAGKFLVIAQRLDARNSARALRLGAAGIFLKSDSANRLMHAIRELADGEMWVDPQVIKAIADHFPMEDEQFNADGLSEREQKVMLGILAGLSNRKIGEDMKLSESSVKAIVQQLFDKTGVRTRSQLVRIAISRSMHVQPRSVIQFPQAEQADGVAAQ